MEMCGVILGLRMAFIGSQGGVAWFGGCDCSELSCSCYSLDQLNQVPSTLSQSNPCAPLLIRSLVPAFRQHLGQFTLPVKSRHEVIV